MCVSHDRSHDLSSTGEWKLSGVEWMYSYNDNIPTKFQSLNKYDPPETHKQSKRKAEKWLVYYCYCGYCY